MASRGRATVEIPLYVKNLDEEYVEIGTITKRIEIVADRPPATVYVEP